MQSEGNPDRGRSIEVTDVRFTAGSIADARAGLVGFVRVTLNNALVADGLTLRRTVQGHLVVSFPEKTDGQGRVHFMLIPKNDRVRRDLESQILRALGFEEGAAS